MTAADLARAARELIENATEPVRYRATDTEVVMVGAAYLRELEYALEPAEREHRPHVWIQRSLHSGAPCIGGTGISGEMLAGFVSAGDSLDILCSMYDVLQPSDVLMACWYTARFGSRRWQTLWGPWADQYDAALYHERWDQIPLPPHRGDSNAK